MKETMSHLWCLAFICVPIYFCGIQYVDTTNNGTSKSLDVNYDNDSQQVEPMPPEHNHVLGNKDDSQRDHQASGIDDGLHRIGSIQSLPKYTVDNVTDVLWVDATQNNGTRNQDQILELASNGSMYQKMENTIGCDSHHIPLSRNMTTAVTLRTFENKPCNVFVSAPSGMGIRMDVMMAQSNQSSNDYFFVSPSSTTDEECLNNIIGIDGPCSMIFPAYELEIITNFMATVHLLPVTIEDSSTNCMAKTTATENIKFEDCASTVTNFTQVFEVDYADIVQYEELITRHPSLNLTFPYLSHPEIQLPLLNLTYGNISVGKLPECASGCNCALNINQFVTECLKNIGNDEILLIFRALGETEVTTLALNGSQRQIIHVSPGSFRSLNDLEILLLDDNLIYNLEEDTFEGLSQLQVLDLSFNNLITMDYGVFDGLSQLRQLFINGNKLTRLSTNMFERLHNIQVLFLRENQISNVDDDVFSDLDNIQVLSLAGNSLPKLGPAIFDDLNKLQYLDLSYNSIANIHNDTFSNLTHMTHLSLMGNNLATFETFNSSLFADLSHLNTLYLNDNQIVTHLNPDLFRDLVNLERLTLNDNYLVNLHHNVFQGLSDLNTLWLHNNALTILGPGIFRDLANLTELILYNNQLSILHVDLFQGLDNLLKLWLHNNILTTLKPGLFKNLTSLTQLSLNDNQLANLDSNLFQGLNNLSELQLHNNQLSDLHEDLFQGLDNLSELWLHNNNLTTLDHGLFRDLANITHLYLDGNKIFNLHVDLLQGLDNLSVLWLHNNILTSLEPGIFRDLAKLTQLYLHNNNLYTLHADLFKGLDSLSVLWLHNNILTSLEPGIFRDLAKLTQLYLGDNNLSHLHKDLFKGMINLTELWVPHNKLTTSSLNSIRNCCDQLQILVLRSNNITNIDANAFSRLRNLIALELNDNQITTIHPSSFSNLTNIKFVTLLNNSLSKITSKSFEGLQNTTTVSVDTPGICCFIESYMGPKCIPKEPKSEFMTCEQLLPNTLLKYSVWIIGVLALVANTYVLIWGCATLTRGKDKKNPKKQVLFIVNLATADFLMGVYMLIIGSADQYYKQYFPIHAENWKTHDLCKLAGFVSVLSSEASLFFLTLIGIDRFWAFRNPGVSRKLFLRTKSKIIVTILTWTAALMVTALGIGLEKDPELYEFSEVCIGLPLARRFITENKNESITITYENIDREDDNLLLNTYEIVGSKLGSTYSIVIFIGVNLICCITVTMCYLCLFIQLCRSNVSTFRSGIKMSLITLTDLMCWMPIIVLGILIQSEVTDMSPVVFAWIIGFVLPINSVINPLLYTIMGSPLLDCLDRKGTVKGVRYGEMVETAL